MRSIVLCATCRHSADEKLGPDGRTGGETLIAHVLSLAADRETPVQIETQSCLWNCKRHCSVFLRDDARFSYFTGDHAPTRAQAEAILNWFELHGETETGEVPFRTWPSAMRGHFLARIPKHSSSPPCGGGGTRSVTVGGLAADSVVEAKAPSGATRHLPRKGGRKTSVTS